jgi:hypothetical protein
MKHPTVRDVAERITQAARDFDSPTRRPGEDFGDQLRRAGDERGKLLGVLTQKQHRENVERERARYRKPKRRAPSVSR